MTLPMIIALAVTVLMIILIMVDKLPFGAPPLLALLLAAEKIRDLKLQPEYTLQEAYTTLEGVRVRAIRYRADFSYERATEPDCCGEVHWLRVVEDVKSEATKTRVYAIKRKLMRERLGIDVREV